MINPHNIFVLIGLLFFQCIAAQGKKDSLALQFHLKFDQAELLPNHQYVSSKNDTLQIEALRFYVSDIKVQYADNSILKSSGSHLVDLAVPDSQRISLDLYTKKDIRKIEFAVGVDSLSNVSGALSGELDPAKGMYWAWQSGYINMKIEGRSPRCKTRKNQFHFHIGGYLKPNNAMRTVVVYPSSQPTIDINVDVAQFFSEVRLSETNSIMIPGNQAMLLADHIVKMFHIE